MAPQSDPLEQLLEQFAADDVPVDTRHRYALRRALLNSTQFESNAAVQQMWGQWMAATGTVLASGAAVAVFVVSVKIADMAALRNVSAQASLAQQSVAVAPPAVEMQVPSSLAHVSFADVRKAIPAPTLDGRGSDSYVGVEHMWNSFQAQLSAAH